MQMKQRLKKIPLALLGVFLISVGVAFNNCAGFGNDSIGILYDGIRAAFHMTNEQLGMASNVVNIALAVFVFIVARRYISIGTIVYLVPYGLFVDIGTRLYPFLFPVDMMAVRITASVVGCLLVCIGIAIYIVIDIGVDPFTGTVLFLVDLTKIQYRYIKIAFDCTLIVIGAVLGGKLGVVTIVTAMAVGPTVQFIVKILKKIGTRN